MYQIIIIGIILVLGILDTSLWFPDFSDLLYLHESDDEEPTQVEDCLQTTNVTEDFHDLSGENPLVPLNTEEQNAPEVTEVQGTSPSPQPIQPAQPVQSTQPSQTTQTTQEPIIFGDPSDGLFTQIVEDVTDYSHLEEDITELVNENDHDINAVSMYGGGAKEQNIQDMLAKLKSTISQDVGQV